MSSTLLIAIAAGAGALVVLALVSLVVRGLRLVRTAARVARETSAAVDELLQHVTAATDQSAVLNAQRAAIMATVARLQTSLARFSVVRGALGEGKVPIRLVRSYINK